MENSPPGMKTMPTGKEEEAAAEFVTVASKFGWAFGFNGAVLLDADSDTFVRLEPRNKNQPATLAAKKSRATMTTRRLTIGVCFSRFFAFTTTDMLLAYFASDLFLN